jgi:hypothetical protein
LVFVLVIFNLTLIAQPSEFDNVQLDTLAIKDHAPYSKKYVNWLAKKGFNSSSYSWKSTDINHQLYDVYEKKHSSKLWGVISGTSLAFGILSPIDQSNYFRFSVGTALVSISQIIRNKQLINQAEEKRIQFALSSNNINSLDNSAQRLYLTSCYRPAQNRKLERMGIDLDKYEWNNLKINLNLYKGLKLRTGRNLASGAALFLLAQGAYIKLLGDQIPIFTAKTYPNEFYIISGLLSGIALLLNKASNKNLRKAKVEYYRIIDQTY